MQDQHRCVGLLALCWSRGGTEALRDEESRLWRVGSLAVGPGKLGSTETAVSSFDGVKVRY